VRFSLDWLLEHLEAAPEADTLAQRLTECGFNVELREATVGGEVWDVEVTTNRPDVMNHRGLAREAAVATAVSLRELELGLEEDAEDASALASVTIDDPALCSRYVARIVRDVKVGDSPQWLKERLAQCGVRPVNAIVDATNYVLLDLGQPLHAFDLGHLRGARIIVRRARAGEALTTLDGERRVLDPSVLVIADSERAMALAGIMGGAETEIQPTTTSVLLESAHFDPVCVRRASRRLGLHTEASHRFERGGDPEMAATAADAAAALIVKLAGGRVCRGRIDVRPEGLRERHLTLAVSALSAFAGLEIATSEVVRILDGLEFRPRPEGDLVRCTVPPFRVDVERAADLYEEVIRHVGYDKVPSQLPVLTSAPGTRRGSWPLVDRARDAAVAAGLHEVMTYPFIDASDDELVATHPLCPGSPLPLENPLALTQNTMRRSLLPGLLAAARDNLNRGERSLTLFEQGRVFHQGSGTRVEAERLGIVLSGFAGSWASTTRIDFGHLKGIVEAVLERVPLLDLAWQRGGAPWFDESEAALLSTADGATVGVAGLLASERAAHWSVRQSLYVAELDLGAAEAEPPLPRYAELARFPVVVVDMTVEHPLALSFAELRRTICTLACEWVAQVELQARYTGEALAEGTVRTTLRLVYRHRDRSLTQEEVNAEQERLRERLAERLGVRFG